MPITDDELDARLRAADADHGIRVDPGVARDLAHRTRREARRRRSWRLGVAFGVGVLVVGLGTAGAPVARHLFLAQDPAGTDGGATWTDLSAPDLRAYIAHVYPDYLVLAPGQTREAAIDFCYRLEHTDEPAVGEEASLRRQLEQYARAGWLDEWFAADDAGDVPRRDRAARQLMDSVTWPANVEIDGGGIVAQDTRWAQAALDGDRASVARWRAEVGG